MLNTNRREAELTHMNTRVENHGQDRVLAVDLKFAFTLNSLELDSVLPGLKETLYRQPEEGEQMELAGGPEAWTTPRHPEMEPVKIKGKFPGYEIELCFAPQHPDEQPGEGEGWIDATLKGQTFDAQKGGVVNCIATASVQVKPEELELIADFLLAEGGILLTLTPPKPAIAPVATAPAQSTADAAEAAIKADTASQAVH